jgi:hypothetical protein
MQYQNNSCCSSNKDHSGLHAASEPYCLLMMASKNKNRNSRSSMLFVAVLVLVFCWMVLSTLQNKSSTSFKESSASSVSSPRLEEKSSFAVWIQHETVDDDNDQSTSSSSSPATDATTFSSTPPLMSLQATIMTRPQEIFHRYMQQHSAHRLRREHATTSSSSISSTANRMLKQHGRRFSVAHYACPQQAGNRLHHFVNDLMLAILTNRTVLVRYWNYEACRQIGNSYDVEACDKRREQQQNSQNRSRANPSSASPSLECDGILRPAPWMALYDDWMPLIEKEYKQQQQLKQQQQQQRGSLSSHNTSTPPLMTGLTIRGKATDDFLPWSTEQRTGPSDDWPVVVFRPLVGVQRANFAHLFFPLDDLSSPKPIKDEKKKKKSDAVVVRLKNTTTTLLWQQQQWQQQKHAAIQAMADQLFSLGADYFFGMLFHESFSFTRDFVESTNVLVQDAPYYQPRQQRLVDLPLLQQQQDDDHRVINNTRRILSIALHSRHVNSLDDGSSVAHETACLEQLLLEHQPQQSSSQPDAAAEANNYGGNGKKNNNNDTDSDGTVQDVCRIFLLSDRPRTIFWIKAWLAKNEEVMHHSCTVITAAHDDKNAKGLEVEHGPFAGAGFYRDLLFASSLSSSSSSSFSQMAWIGHDRRSSSKLLLEWMEYRRYQNKRTMLSNGENVGRSTNNVGNNDDSSDDARLLLPAISLCQLPEEKPETKSNKK